MKTRITFLAAVVLASIASAQDRGMVKLTQDGNTVRVEIDGQPFTTYHYGPGLGRVYFRPFFYPVLAPDGTAVTADQTSGGGDHPHHRSLWVAQGDVNGADHWAHRGPKQQHVGFKRLEGDTIEQELVWEDKEGEAMLKEERTLRFRRFADGNRGVDFTLVFTPLIDSVTFGDTKEAGLCSVRVVKAISDRPTITNAAGGNGEKECWGKPAKWCDISGEIDGKPYGVAILDHPGNPRHPSPWHVRTYGLMGANIFGLHDFDRSLPRGAGDFTMTKGNPVTFRYRVIIHGGDAASAKLDEKFDEFAAER